MAGKGISLGFSESSSKGTGRQQARTEFPKQFILDQNATLGGPFTMSDLFNLAPRPRSLFGYAPTSAQRPGGGVNLGFGAANTLAAGRASMGDAGSGMEMPGGDDTQPQPPPPGGGLGSTPPAAPPPGGAQPPAAPGAGEKKFSLNDLTTSYYPDPDKVMDLPRLFRSAGLNQNGFTYAELEAAVNNAKNYGFSGRSQGNFAQMLANLQRDQKLDEQLGSAGVGGKGSGIF